MWIKRVAQLYMYRWNKSKSLLERNFWSFGVDWDRWMVNKFWNSFWNSTNDFSEGGLGWCKSTGPSNTLGRDAGGDGSDSDEDEEDPEEDLEEETDETETQSGV